VGNVTSGFYEVGDISDSGMVHDFLNLSSTDAQNWISTINEDSGVCNLREREREERLR
jgi:hypothetical protein